MLGTALLLVATATASVTEPGWDEDGMLLDEGSGARAYRLALRSLLGFGWGALAGATGEYWASDHVGLGIHGARYAGGVWGASWTGYGAGPSLALRTSATGSYGLLEVSAGPGLWYRTDSGGFCIDWDGNEDCPPTSYSSGTALYAGAGLGWVWHPGGVEIGPMLRLDGMDSTFTVTISLALGYATPL